MLYPGSTADLHIDHKAQFFFDSLMIESAQDIVRRVHKPRRVDGAPFLTADKPWETISYICCSTWNVIWDEADRLFKCWYTDWQFRDESFWTHVDPFRLLYACSEDGIHWTKPALGVVREAGQDTNIVLGGNEQCWKVFATSVFIDPLDPDPARRFKTLFDHIAPQHGEVMPAREIRAAYSADGIHWTVYAERPTCGARGQLFDDIIILDVDRDARRYVAYTRHSYRYDFVPNPKTPRTKSIWPPYYPFDPGRENRPGVWVSESSDFIHWSEPCLVLALDDEEDNLDDRIYALTPIDLGSHRVGLLNMLHSVDNTIDVQLVHSRDGRRWQRTNQRQPYLGRGSAGSWDENVVNVPSRPLVVGDELYIYYGGSRFHHDWWFFQRDEGLDVPEAKDLSRVRQGMGLAKLRLDGFVSLGAAPIREGILVTRPFVSDGTRLVINAACGPGGYIDVEVVDANDDVLPGCSRAECDTLHGDSVRHVVTWRGRGSVPVPPPTGPDYSHPQVPYARSSQRKLRFYMRNADLYSFRLDNGE